MKTVLFFFLLLPFSFTNTTFANPEAKSPTEIWVLEDDILTITLDPSEDITEVEVFNSAGQTMFVEYSLDGNVATVYMNTLATGTYLVVATTAENAYRQRIVYKI